MRILPIKRPVEPTNEQPVQLTDLATDSEQPRDKRAFVILVDHRVVYKGKTIRTLEQVRADYARTVRSLMGPGGRPGIGSSPYRAIYHTLAEVKTKGKSIDYAWR